ncbi:MAG: flippase-like domain-containing protein [Clostridia bacterium]|nr:flippase-like domain-containing protein [Clostridia bacterium]
MKLKKIIINAFVFIFFVSITFYIVFKNNDIIEIFQIIMNVDKKFILIAIICMLNFIFSEGINIYRTLKLLNCKINIKDGIKYALVGFFFSSVTPGASGGDPMQLYYMKRDGLPISHSTLAILTEFSSFQFVTIVMSIIGFFVNYKFIENSIGNIKYFLLIGVIINTAILIIILLTIFSKKIIVNLVNIIGKVLNKFHYKKIEEFKLKCLEQINEYKIGSNLLMKNKKVLIKIILTTILQVILYHSIPYFIYLSFGLTEASFFQFLTLQSVLYISVSTMPLPGSVGVSEGGFLIIYKVLFQAQLLSSAMLLSRGISFYLFVVITGILVLSFSLNYKNVKNRI